jgi:hypothetical protein
MGIGLRLTKRECQDAAFAVCVTHARRYAGFDFPATMAFILFAVTFLVSRLIMFPYIINRYRQPGNAALLSWLD